MEQSSEGGWAVDIDDEQVVADMMEPRDPRKPPPPPLGWSDANLRGIQQEESEGSSDEDDDEEDDMLDGIQWQENKTKPGFAESSEVMLVESDEETTGGDGNPGNGKGAGSKNRKSRTTKRTRNRIELTHRMDLLCKVAEAIKLNQEIDEAVLSKKNVREKLPEPFQRIDKEKRLQLVINWFRKEVKVDHSKNASLSEICESMSGPELRLLLAFIAMLRGSGVPARLVASMHPRGRLASASRKRKKRRTESGKAGEIRHKYSPSSANKYWIEVLVGDLESVDGKLEWISFHVFNGVLREKEQKLSEADPYIVAFGTGNHAMDVTRRYAKRWTKTSRQRHNEIDGWWEHCTLLGLRQDAKNWLRCNEEMLSKAQRKGFEVAMNEDMEEKERLDLQSRGLEEDLPTSLDGFRRHPFFVLEKHVRKYEGLKPDTKVVGFFKGENVYLRADVVELCSRTGWRRRGRIVMGAEVENPVKKVEPRGKAVTIDFTENQLPPPSMSLSKPLETLNGKEVREESEKNFAKKDGNEEGEAEEQIEEEEEGGPMGKIPLYGEWQTDKYQPPSIGEDGSIPKNEYGNVELWSPEHCPIGAVHINDSLVEKAAKQLGIDYAGALVGFEQKIFRMLPKFDGIIVAKSNEQIVRDAAEMLRQERIRKAAEKKSEEVLKRWATLVKAVVVKCKLQRKYAESYSSSPPFSPPIALRSQKQSCDHEFDDVKTASSGFEVRKCKFCGMKTVEEDF